MAEGCGGWERLQLRGVVVERKRAAETNPFLPLLPSLLPISAYEWMGKIMIALFAFS